MTRSTILRGLAARRRASSIVAAALLVVGPAAVGAACGGGSSDDTATTAPDGAAGDGTLGGQGDASGGDASGGGGDDGGGTTEGGARDTGAPLPPPPPPFVAWTAGQASETGVYVARFDGTAWRALPGAAGASVSAAVDPSAEPALAMGPDGKAVVAWSARAAGGPSDVYVARWNGTAWEELAGSATRGGVSKSTGSSFGASTPSVAVNPVNGDVLLAWEQIGEREGGVCCEGHVYVRRWNGTAWEELAGSASGVGVDGTNPNASSVGPPAIAVDGTGHAFVVWQNEPRSSSSPTPCDIYGKRWNGTAWEELGGSASGMGLSQAGTGLAEPSVVIGQDGNPVVSWALSGVEQQFRARVWTGSSWDALGSTTTGQGCTAGLRFPLALDSSFRPVVTTHQETSSGQVQVHVWDGQVWNDLPRLGSLTAGSGSTGALRDGGLLTVFEDRTASLRSVLYAETWNGAAWRDLPDGSSSDPGIAPSDGGLLFGPVVATGVPP